MLHKLHWLTVRQCIHYKTKLTTLVYRTQCISCDVWPSTRDCPADDCQLVASLGEGLCGQLINVPVWFHAKTVHSGTDHSLLPVLEHGTTHRKLV